METKNVKATHNTSVDEDDLDIAALEFLYELEVEHTDNALQPGEITTSHYRNRLGITYSAARSRLERGVREGEFTKREGVLYRGSVVNAYKKAG